MKSHISEHNATKSLDLVQASYFLSEGEHKLLNLLASTMNSHDPEQSDTVSIEVSAYAELVGISLDKARRVVLNSLTSLWERELSWATSEGVYRCRWFQKVGVLENGTVTVVWSSEAMAGLSNLQNSKYVQLINEHSMVIKGGYSIRMFELLASERYIGNWDKQANCYKVMFEVGDLMTRLDVPKSYKAYKLFKVNVLSKCIEELADKGIALMVLKEYRVGRKIARVEFHVKWLVGGAKRKAAAKAK